jgi:ABC-type Fe3+ transport system substrate-binding protein
MLRKKVFPFASLVLLIALVWGSFGALGVFAQGATAEPEPTPTIDPTTGGVAWGGDIVPDVPKDEVAAAIKAEGANLIISGFPSGEVRSQYQPTWFKAWVKEIYGVDIEFQFVPAEGDGIIEQLKAAKNDKFAPIDLMGTENLFVNSAIKQGLVAADVLADPLIPLAKLLPAQMTMANTAFRIQGAEGVIMVYNPKYVDAEKVKPIKKWTDVADLYKEYSGKILWWHPLGDPAGLAQILSVTLARGADYKDNAEIRKSIEWIKENVDPYVLRYVRGYGDFTVLVEKEEAYITVMWYGTSKKYILSDLVRPIWLENSMSMPGYMAMVDRAPHPTLAKLYMNFQMSHYVQFPPYPADPPYDVFKIDEANWLRGCFGGVGIPGDYDRFMPDWAKQVVPPAEVVNEWLVDVDWDYVFANKGDWQEMWGEIIGE